MEQDSTLVPATAIQQPKACIDCGNPNYLKGYPNALCAECREKYIKYPIPLWVKGFGGGVALVVIFLLFNLPKTLGPAIGYEKAVKAEGEKNYLTEQRELQPVVKEQPGFLEAEAHLIIAAYYNNDLNTLSAMSTQLSGKSFDDDALLNKVNHILDLTDNAYPSEAFGALLKQYPDSAGGMADTTFERYISQNQSEIFPKFLYASILDDRKKYTASDSLLQAILLADPDNIAVLSYEAGLKRVMGDTKASLKYLDHLLELNKQSVSGLAGKARTLLKLQQLKEGLDYAQKAYDNDPNDEYAVSTLIMAYHFNNMQKERDALISKTKQPKDSTDKSYITYALDVINKKDSL